MRTARLASWSKNKFGIIMGLFFIALAIPTAILIYQAYSQLKWEAFYQHRVMAEELVNRIDEKIKTLIETENKRAFTQYTFLNITGDSKVNFLQRSPLAHYPIRSSIPGLIGHFQIDHLGGFSTPLLPNPIPTKIKLQQNYGLSEKELALRKNINDQIYNLLSDNRLVESTEGIKPGSAALNDIVKNDSDKNRSQKNESEVADSLEEKVHGLLSPDRKDKARISSEESSSDESYLDEQDVDAVGAQSGFDKLQQQRDQPRASKGLQASRAKLLGRVSDLKLENRYREKLALNEREALKKSATENKRAPQEAPAKSKRPLRKEQNILPSQVAVQPRPSLLTPEKSNEQHAAGSFSDSFLDDQLKENRQLVASRAPVDIFESEIGAFQLSLLDTGHFVLYRNGWRDGQRSIQGLLIEAEPFINSVVAENFLQTALVKTTELTTAYRGNVLTVLSSINAGSYLSNASELEGSLLLQRQLSAPLDQMELLFSVNNLPAGPGAQVINWLSIVLLLILPLGMLLIYRLGLKQINLVRQQQDFVSAVSHELKTPLTSIRMYGELLREGWASEDKKRTYYDFIYDESERLSRLINNVLQLARMTRSDLKLELLPCSIAQLVDTLRSKISSQIEHAGFELEIVCDSDILQRVVDVDADAFVQIIINLVDNAIKFSANATTKKVDINCTALRDGRIQISVRDYGPGIEKSQMRKIFKLFYRSENELTRDTVGTGIGLALVNQLVASMNGQIDVVNQNPGVEFRITFATAIQTSAS